MSRCHETGLVLRNTQEIAYVTVKDSSNTAVNRRTLDAACEGYHCRVIMSSSLNANGETKKVVVSLDYSDYICTLCLQAVMKKKSFTGRRFGILDCQHIFCADCIVNYIKKEIEKEKPNYEFEDQKLLKKVLICPACKLPSTAVMSSRKPLINEDEKIKYRKEFEKAFSNCSCLFLKTGIPRCYCTIGHSAYVCSKCEFPIIFINNDLTKKSRVNEKKISKN